MINEASIVELKAVARLARVYEEPRRSYLWVTGLDEGLLVNFGNVRGLEWQVLTL